MTVHWDTNPTAKRVLKYAKKGDWFTIKQLRQQTSITIGQAVYYTNHLVNEGYLEQTTPPTKSTAVEYRWCDVIAELPLHLSRGGMAEGFFERLKSLALTYREGHIDSEEDDNPLEWERLAIVHAVEQLEGEIKSLNTMLNCADLWDRKSLVKRIGFLDDEG